MEPTFVLTFFVLFSTSIGFLYPLNFFDEFLFEGKGNEGKGIKTIISNIIIRKIKNFFLSKVKKFLKIG